MIYIILYDHEMQTSNCPQRHSPLILKPLHKYSYQNWRFPAAKFIGKDLLSLALLYRLRNEGPERFSDVNKTTQLIKDKDGIWGKVIWLKK